MNKLKKLNSLKKQGLGSAKQKLKQAEATTLPSTTTAQNTAEKKEKFKVTEGPMLWVSTLLNSKGPLSAHGIWAEYLKDQEAKSKNILNSKTHLKRHVLDKMKLQGKIENAGFSHINNEFIGYKIIPQIAFKNVHPDIIEKLEPKPELKSKREPFSLDNTPASASQAKSF